jgi:cytoskeletal protein RodZ
VLVIRNGRLKARLWGCLGACDQRRPHVRGRPVAACSNMSGVSGVSGGTGHGDASAVMGTDKPVFSDDSGFRAAVLKWGVWAICFVAVLLGGALVLTLRTHVALPGVDRLSPPLRGRVEGGAAVPTEQQLSQPQQPSITLQPSVTFRPATEPTARPSSTAKRAGSTASSAKANTRAPAAQATSSAQETTRARNSKAANPSPPASRPTSKPGNGPG